MALDAVNEDFDEDDFAGGEHFARLEINQTAMIKQLLLITSNPPLDALFASAAT